MLGEEVDVAGLKRAIEAPRPVESRSRSEGEQIPLVEAAVSRRAGDETQTADEADKIAGRWKSASRRSCRARASRRAAGPSR